MSQDGLRLYPRRRKGEQRTNGQRGQGQAEEEEEEEAEEVGRSVKKNIDSQNYDLSLLVLKRDNFLAKTAR